MRSRIASSCPGVVALVAPAEIGRKRVGASAAAIESEAATTTGTVAGAAPLRTSSWRLERSDIAASWLLMTRSRSEASAKGVATGARIGTDAEGVGIIAAGIVAV